MWIGGGGGLGPPPKKKKKASPVPPVDQDARAAAIFVSNELAALSMMTHRIYTIPENHSLANRARTDRGHVPMKFGQAFFARAMPGAQFTDEPVGHVEIRSPEPCSIGSTVFGDQSIRIVISVRQSEPGGEPIYHQVFRQHHLQTIRTMPEAYLVSAVRWFEPPV